MAVTDTRFCTSDRRIRPHASLPTAPTSVPAAARQRPLLWMLLPLPIGTKPRCYMSTKSSSASPGLATAGSTVGVQRLITSPPESAAVVSKVTWWRLGLVHAPWYCQMCMETCGAAGCLRIFEVSSEREMLWTSPTEASTAPCAATVFLPSVGRFSANL